MNKEGGFIRNPFVRNDIEELPKGSPKARNLTTEAKDVMAKTNGQPIRSQDVSALNVIKQYLDNPSGGGISRTELATAVDQVKRSLAIKRTQGGSINVGAMVDDLKGKKKVVGTPDPQLRTNKEVPMKDLSGQKFTVPANTVLTPRTEGGKVYLDVDGKTYTVAKNQYDNLKGQSTRAVATPFAPELEGTSKVVKGKPLWEGNDLIIDGERMADVYRNDDGTWSYRTDFEEGSPGFRTRDEAVSNAEADVTGIGSQSGTKYDQYTLPGGENYTEILRTAPKSDFTLDWVEANNKFRPDVVLQAKASRRNGQSTNVYIAKEGGGFYVWEPDGQLGSTAKTLEQAKKIAEDTLNNNAMVNTADYRSSHWSDTPNVIYHVRLNDRTFNGKKVTFMEELQSDWAREARKASDEMLKERQMYERDLQLLKTEKDVVNREAKIKALEEKLADLKSDVPPVPSNPLLKDWQIPAVKDALMEAVDRKSKIFAWINGDQTSARYNLATYVDEVKWDKVGNTKNIYLDAKDGKSIVVMTDKNGIVQEGRTVPSDWKGKKLDEVLGKGLADEIMKADKGNLSGDGLKFGGEWANNLYDKQVRDIVKKLTGAEVKKGDMGLSMGGAKQHQWRNTKGEVLTQKDIRVGNEVWSDGIVGGDIQSPFIITKVTGDGKFNAVQKNTYDLHKDGHAGKTGDWGSAEETFDISTPKAEQQYIELTPDVVAKIQGKAPNLKLNRDITTYGIPLLMLYFSQGGNQ